MPSNFCNVTNTARCESYYRYWKRSFPGRLLKKAVYEHGRTTKYLQELALRKKTGKETTVKTVAIKKSGRPLLLKQKSPSFLAYNV